MAHHCTTCGGLLQKTRAHHRYLESGLSFVLLANCNMLACKKCDETMAILPNAEILTPHIVERLIREKNRLNCEAIRFIRRSMGLTSDEFAALLNTTRVEVSRWENGRARISPIMDLRLRREVVDHLLPPSENRHEVLEDIARTLTKDYKPTAKQEDLVVDLTQIDGTQRLVASSETPVGAAT